MYIFGCNLGYIICAPFLWTEKIKDFENQTKKSVQTCDYLMLKAGQKNSMKFE